MPILKVGIIGFGEMARIHAEALLEIPETSLVAIADPDPQKTDDAKPYKCAVYDDAEVMLREAKLDFVIVATQAPLHHELTIAALQKHVHVICEKPMALSLREADQMVEAATANNRLLAVNHQWIFMHAAKRAKELVQEDLIGELQFIEAFGKGRSPAYDLMEIAGHNLHLMYWLAGPVEWMTGHVQQKRLDVTKSDARVVSEMYPGGRECGIGAGDYMRAEYKFQSGVCGALHLTQLESHGNDFMSVELRGTKGRLKIFQDGGGHLVFNKSPLDSSTPSQWEVIPLSSAWTPAEGLPTLIPATRELIQDFLDAIRQEKKPEISGEDGRAALEMALGVYTAHLAGKRLSVPPCG